jgi:putative ABC transport system ATP-binding protein
MPQKSVISLKNIEKVYENGDIRTQVLFDINLEITGGEFIAITGPSGSGKSTLLNILGLLDTASTGTYILNGTDVTKLTEDEQSYYRNKEIGFVFQSFNLLQRATALENVILPSIYAGMKQKEREIRAADFLIQVGLGDHLQKRPNQMSGGQQQRVAIARALMNDPAIILADEPTGNLDTKSGEDVMGILKKLNKEGKTIIMITHEHDIAKQAQKIVYIRDGRISNRLKD